MTDQDNLRNRIASIVAERNAYFGGHIGRADPKAVAQAIIDELHLFAEVDEDWGAMVIEGWWEKQ